MNKSFVWGLLCLALTVAHTGYAQLTCDQRAESILQFEADFPDYPLELINSLLDDILPCSTPQSASSPSWYIAGKLYWLSDRDRKDITGRNLIVRSSNQLYSPGVRALLIEYLTGEHNYNNAPEYDRAYKLADKIIKFTNGNQDLAYYVRGYIQMKHMTGGTNYFTYLGAKQDFEKSNLPMAKHWLAVMHYFGHGVPQDKAKALQMLGENDILNSRTLLQYLQTQNSDWTPISVEEHDILFDGRLPLYKPTPEQINGTYDGRLIEFDWSFRYVYNKGGVKRDIPFTLDVQYEDSPSGSGNFTYEFDIEGKKIAGTGFRSSFFMQFPNGGLNIPLKRLYKDHPDKDSITVNIKDIVLSKAKIDNDSVVIARFGRTREDAKIVEFNENSPVISAILKKRTSTTIAARSLSSSPIDQDFAIISPNPITDSFNLTYNLKENDEIQISVYDMFGNERIVLPQFRSKSSDQQSITINSNELTSGLYLVQMTVNGQSFTKTIAKQ